MTGFRISWVTWDEYSLFINGNRVNLWSGEVHPYRMPVQSLHLDVFQKVKSLGFNAISAYFFWGIHEAKRGEISFEGFRDLQPFFDAAMKAGIYVIARPGSCGFPGWGTHTAGLWRTSNTSYVEAYTGSANQITKGGPVILVQTENEYSDFTYESDLKAILRSVGVTVPLIVNDAWPGGHFTDVDIYGYDSYPNGFDCAHPNVWLPGAAAAFDPWGGVGYEGCAELLGPEFERVFYKNEFAMSTTILNLYMLFGGTNWGGTSIALIRTPGVYTSYDYGSAIAEDRTLREKYYELKLQANFRAVSPAGSFTGNQALKTTQVLDVVGNKTGFYVVRQLDASTTAVQTYTLTLSTSIGTLTIPTIGGSLALNGKDSKIHVVDYCCRLNDRELHETAFKFTSTVPTASVVSGTATIKTKVLAGNSLALQFQTTGQTVVQVGNVLLYILDRANAYQFWVLHPPTTGAFAQFSTQNPILVKGGYLLRSVTTTGGVLALTGDLNTTTPVSFEIIAPAAFKSVTFNGAKLAVGTTRYGTLTAQRTASLPAVTLPNLAALKWKTADSLPEIQPQYSDEQWVVANHTTTVNPTPANTSVVLYAGDYGFHTGNILWRAHFAATGAEKGFEVAVQGGSAFGFSVWLDATFIGSWVGDAVQASFNGTFPFPTALKKGTAHVLTILQDHMGNEENWWAAGEDFKTPRGILSYAFTGSPATTVSLWKVAGNLGGESFADNTRGPLNEGGLFGERQGWHLPNFDDTLWAAGAPTAPGALPHAGVAFFRTTFTLNIPPGVDYPLALVFANATSASGAAPTPFRAQLYVNGWQFGKYVNHIGPQTSFPVPQGILNYSGAQPNTLALSLWAPTPSGAHLAGLALKLTARVESGMPTVANAEAGKWVRRAGAF
ncbi:glycoside hydrolase family 35 protein [Mycena filopes]|nr:glycoside hydrolase family 35 protein [Mycena filopes]